MNGGGITGRVVEWLSSASLDVVPRRAVEEVKNQIFSTIAAIHAGHFSDAGRCVIRAVKDWAGSKEATLVPSGERVGVCAAIAGNVALASALEYDDYMLGARTGAAAVPVALALAERSGASGVEVLLALVLANEVAGRVGLAAGLGPLDEQVHTFPQVAASAVIAARLLKLDPRQTAHALGLALAQPPVALRSAFYGSEARLTNAALAVPAAVQAAELALHGLRGGYDVFDPERGLLAAVGGQPQPGAFKGFGKVWLTESLGYRIYPANAFLGPVIDCVLGLVRQHHVDARKVSAVNIGAMPLVVELTARTGEYLDGYDSLPGTLTHSARYCTAVALIDREFSPRQLARDRIKDPAVWHLAGKVRVYPDEELVRRARERAPLRPGAGDGGRVDLEIADLIGFKAAFGARVRIETEGGRVFEMEQEVPAGSGGRPFDDRRKAVEDKFRRETRYTLRKERMERAIDIIHHLDGSGATHVRELVRLCCSERM